MSCIVEEDIFVYPTVSISLMRKARNSQSSYFAAASQQFTLYTVKVSRLWLKLIFVLISIVIIFHFCMFSTKIATYGILHLLCLVICVQLFLFYISSNLAAGISCVCHHLPLWFQNTALLVKHEVKKKCLNSDSWSSCQCSISVFSEMYRLLLMEENVLLDMTL